MYILYIFVKILIWVILLLKLYENKKCCASVVSVQLQCVYVYVCVWPHQYPECRAPVCLYSD